MQFLCQRCKQSKATVHVTDTFPTKQERHLCEDCAAEEGIIIKQPETTQAILQEFLKQQDAPTREQEELKCSECGLTLREFQARGLLGCPNDYTAFRSVLAPLLERAHKGATEHVGKCPPSADGGTRRRMDLLRFAPGAAGSARTRELRTRRLAAR